MPGYPNFDFLYRDAEIPSTTIRSNTLEDDHGDSCLN